MKQQRRKHSAEFKAKVALEALREQKTLSELSEQYSLHANQISDWKKVLVEGTATLFKKGSEGAKAGSVVDLDAFCAPYLEQIGALQMEVNFLKKKLKQLNLG